MSKKTMQVSAQEGTRTCAICGKEMWIPDLSSWAWRRRGARGAWLIWFCSWTCMRKWDKDHPLTAHQNPVLIVRPAKNKKQKGSE